MEVLPSATARRQANELGSDTGLRFESTLRVVPVRI